MVQAIQRTLLQKKRYKLNPYDRFVSNKTTEGKQFTLSWYIDYNKALHSNKKVIDELLEDLRKHFGDLVVTRGGNNCFLGMKIQITDNKRIEIYTKEQFEEVKEKFGEKLGDRYIIQHITTVFSK